MAEVLETWCGGSIMADWVIREEEGNLAAQQRDKSSYWGDESCDGIVAFDSRDCL